MNFTFEEESLKTITSYKYLGLDFIDNYKWNACVGLKALYNFQNKCRKAYLWNWEMIVGNEGARELGYKASVISFMSRVTYSGMPRSRWLQIHV